MRKAMALVLALVMLAGVVPAQASPAGVWELETRDTRFGIELCGDGTQLCGTLVWLSDTDYNVQYKPFLNTPMANQIAQTGPNRWKGAMRLFGRDVTGTITQRSEDVMTLTGCMFMVVCKTYEMYRVNP